MVTQRGRGWEERGRRKEERGKRKEERDAPRTGVSFVQALAGTEERIRSKGITWATTAPPREAPSFLFPPSSFL